MRSCGGLQVGCFMGENKKTVWWENEKLTHWNFEVLKEFGQFSKLQVFANLDWYVMLHFLWKLMTLLGDAYESREIKNCPKKSWNEWIMNDQNWPSKVLSIKKI